MAQDDTQKPSFVPENAESVPPDDESNLALVQALMAGSNLSEAARLAHISRSTAYRRLADPEVRALIAQARAVATQQVLNRLTALLEDSVAALERALGKTSPLPIQISAARLVLEARAKLIDSVDLDDRIQRVEERLDERAGEKGSR